VFIAGENLFGFDTTNITNPPSQNIRIPQFEVIKV